MSEAKLRWFPGREPGDQIAKSQLLFADTETPLTYVVGYLVDCEWSAFIGTHELVANGSLAECLEACQRVENAHRELCDAMGSPSVRAPELTPKPKETAD